MAQGWTTHRGGPRTDAVRGIDVLVLLLITLASVATRAVWYGDPAADFDEQLYSLIGAGLLDGHLPYTDLWDRKPFGLFAIFAFAHAIGGSGPLAYQLLATGFVILGGWLVYRLARLLTDPVTAGGAALLYPALIYAYGSISAQSEAFFVPLLLGMLLLLTEMNGQNTERRAAWAMALGGLALQVKYTVGPQCLFLGAVALWHFRHEPAFRLLARTLVYGLIGFAPTLLIALIYVAHGEFDHFLYANIFSNFERTPALGGRMHMGLVQPLAPLVLLALGGVYAAFRLNPPRNAPIYRLYAGWSLAVLAGIIVPGTVYIYYFAAFAPCAILLSLPLLDRTGPLRWAPLVLVLLGGFALTNTVRHWHESQRSRTELPILVQRLASLIRADRDCLMVFDGPTALYRLTGSCLPGRIVYPDHLNNALEQHALGVDQTAEVARILATRPGAIVTADKPATEQNPAATALVDAALKRHYRHIGQARVRGRTIHGWGRRD